MSSAKLTVKHCHSPVTIKYSDSVKWELNVFDDAQVSNSLSLVVLQHVPNHPNETKKPLTQLATTVASGQTSLDTN